MTRDRAARLAESMRAELAELILREVKDPGIAAAGLVTITHVTVTPDLGNARVLVSFTPPLARSASVDATGEAAGPALAALERASGFLRGEIGRRLGLKRAPTLRFVHDTTAERAAQIEALLRDDDKPGGGGDGAT